MANSLKRIKRISKTQAIKNRIIARSKQSLIKEHGCCQICGNRSMLQLAHLLPKGRYPEYYLEQMNHALFCQECHELYDNDIDFRQSQIWAYDKIRSFAPIEADKYFRINNF